LEEKSPKAALPEVDREYLDNLKRQDEWKAMINLFARDLYEIQDAMLADLPEERLKYLSAKGSMAQRYLTMALEEPGPEEG
jgi:hypothetical protein